MDACCIFFGRVKALGCVLLAVVLLCGAPAYAATACVNTPLQLALVLSAAQNNGEDDLIKVEVGTYLLGGELDYIAAPTETHDLTVSGGWAPGCLALASSGSSALDGQHAVRPLYVATHGRVNIYNLTFQNGNPAADSGGGLYISGSTNAILDVESSIFINNKCATTIGGAILMSVTGVIYLKNSLFIANSGASTVYIANDYIAELNNNTIVGNQLANHVGQGALYLAGSGQYSLSNNILWNNEGTDSFNQSGMASFYNNDIGVRGGLPALAESNGLSVDPQFSGFLSVLPAPDSPLVNAGLDSPLGGIGSTDLAGNPRLVGKHVDIGAYETDVLFRGLFD